MGSALAIVFLSHKDLSSVLLMHFCYCLRSDVASCFLSFVDLLRFSGALALIVICALLVFALSVMFFLCTQSLWVNTFSVINTFVPSPCGMRYGYVAFFR